MNILYIAPLIILFVLICILLSMILKNTFRAKCIKGGNPVFDHHKEELIIKFDELFDENSILLLTTIKENLTDLNYNFIIATLKAFKEGSSNYYKKGSTVAAINENSSTVAAINENSIVKYQKLLISCVKHSNGKYEHVELIPLNIGIEIEACANRRKINLKHFDETNDDSIACIYRKHEKILSVNFEQIYRYIDFIKSKAAPVIEKQIDSDEYLTSHSSPLKNIDIFTCDLQQLSDAGGGENIFSNVYFLRRNVFNQLYVLEEIKKEFETRRQELEANFSELNAEILKAEWEEYNEYNDGVLGDWLRNFQEGILSYLHRFKEETASQKLIRAALENIQIEFDKMNKYIPIEYVLRGIVNSNSLSFDYSNSDAVKYEDISEPTLMDDIIEIVKNTSDKYWASDKLLSRPNGCKNQDVRKYKSLYTCGLHFHASSDLIPIDHFGLVFLINLIIAWCGDGSSVSVQDRFLNKFLYQLTIQGVAYSDKNNTINTQIMAELIRLKQFIIENKLLINNREQLDNIISLMPSDRPFLSIVSEDQKYIHLEFRGLLPWSLITQIPIFIEELVKLYTIIYNQTVLEF